MGIASEESAGIAKAAKVNLLYLMPILLSKTEQEAANEVSSIHPNVHIPRDLEEFIVQ